MKLIAAKFESLTLQASGQVDFPSTEIFVKFVNIKQNFSDVAEKILL